MVFQDRTDGVLNHLIGQQGGANNNQNNQHGPHVHPASSLTAHVLANGSSSKIGVHLT